jgi:hypothetical protein
LKAPQGFDRIKFLVDQKFGFKGKTVGGVTHFTADRLAKTNPALADEISIYKAQLIGLPSDELQALYDAEFKKLLEEQNVESERAEQERFFYQPHARADIAHWSKAAHWTLNEAVALSFGKAPEIVNWEKIQPFLKISAFAFQYGRVRDLALRALLWKQLYDPVLPGIFAAWAKRNDLPFPSDLEAALTGRGVQVADWKSLYDDSQRLLEESREALTVAENETASLQEAFSKALNLVDVLKDRNDELTTENEQLADAVSEVIEARDAAESSAAELQSRLDAGSQTEKPFSLRERESLLRLVIGMATAGYKYDGKAPRNTATSEIASDLEELGIGLDVDTVRKWLREAAEILPRGKTE